jgi:hypothetical protein
VHAYSLAALLSSESTQELRRHTSTAQMEEFKRLEQIASDALFRCERTRLGLAKHRDAHHC